jgi:putative transposase
MARPLRIEFPHALYHVTARGNRQEAIYLDEEDRQAFLACLSNVYQRFNWTIHAYCLMDNHYHLLVETPESNLSAGMRQLNGVYTQTFNRHHKRVGHVFQGRFKGILVEKETYLLELSRYIVLNPVRAQMVRSAKDWLWSSYRTTAGLSNAPDWLAIDWLLSQFGKRRQSAMEAYRKFVAQGKGQLAPWSELKQQIYLGSDEFVDEMQSKAELDADLTEIPAAQKRRIPKPLVYFQTRYSDRNTAIQKAFESGGYSQAELGRHFGLHYSRISRIIKQAEKARSKTSYLRQAKEI